MRAGSPAGVDVRTIKVPAGMRRRGETTRAMARIARWADKTATVLYLWANPFADKPVTEARLRRFYAGFGFRPYERRIMQRQPRPVVSQRDLHRAEKALERAARLLSETVHARLEETALDVSLANPGKLVQIHVGMGTWTMNIDWRKHEPPIFRVLSRLLAKWGWHAVPDAWIRYRDGKPEPDTRRRSA